MQLSDRIEWRDRLAKMILDARRPDVDGEILLTQLMAGIDQAHQEGLIDAAEICRKVATLPNAARIATRLAEAIEQLQRKNNTDSQASLHTW